MNSPLVALTKRLIRIQSTADHPKQLTLALETAIEHTLQNPILSVKRYRSGGKPSAVIATDTSKRPDILMVGHVDVVPGVREMFKPRLVGTKLSGRGTYDMKGQVAVMLEAIRQYDRPTGPSVALMLTTDEEQGGANGAGYLVKDQRYRPKVAMVPDSGDRPEQIVTDNKGVIHAEITAPGKASHAAQPWDGRNAVSLAAEAIRRVEQEWPPPKSLRDWRTSCAVTRVIGGHTINQVPDTAMFRIDLRFVERDDPRKLVARLKRIVKPCRVFVAISEPASHTALSDPAVRLYRKCAREVTGRASGTARWSGANDGRFFSAQGIPVLASRPVGGDVHGDREWLDVRSQAQFLRLYQRFLDTYPG